MMQSVFIVGGIKMDMESDTIDLLIEEEAVSEYSKKIFDEDIKGKSLYDVLFSNIDLDSEFGSGIKFALECSFGMDELQWRQGIDALPMRVLKRRENDHIVLKISYNPLRDEQGEMEKLMIVAEDVTELEKLEYQMKVQKEEEGKFTKTSTRSCLC